ncbi:hypothetical protein EI983_17805 [Roseovarius faecimaris]|uniref:Uncharacterized protein n=1 Tax=Roseovarius faecimaris TaxID=2494550 RepID=A0A6I6IVT1_9RHOB|nr:hypothetical protein [Roseovarius faecimaris]QGY00024.1 hypothetical protein EI983_17805 [Roseovarius faecimaris]
MSNFTFHIHYIFPTSSLEIYGDALNTLFGGAENNPFGKDSILNKIPLPSGSAFADALSALNAANNTVFSDLGIGANYHGGGHQSYNTFVSGVLEQIFNQPGLDTYQQQVAVFALHSFLTDMAVSGEPRFSEIFG